jgi:hypothetical protein
MSLLSIFINYLYIDLTQTYIRTNPIFSASGKRNPSNHFSGFLLESRINTDLLDISILYIARWASTPLQLASGALVIGLRFLEISMTHIPSVVHGGKWLYAYSYLSLSCHSNVNRHTWHQTLRRVRIVSFPTDQ